MPETTTQSTNEAPATETTDSTVQAEQSTEETKQESTEQAPPQTKKKLKLKVDGEEFEYELDLNNDDELRKHLQMSHAARKRMSEAMEAKRKAIDIVKAFEQDPKSVLQRLGPKGREIAEQFLLEQIQETMMSAEEKELRELRKLKSEFEARQKADQERQQKEAQEAQTSKYREHYQKIFVDALQKTKLPKSDRLVKDMAELQYKSIQLGIELTAEDLAQELEARELAKIKSLLDSSEGDQLLSLLGDDIANKIRKSDVAKIKAKLGDNFKPSTTKVESPKPQGKHYMTPDEWRESIRNRVRS